MAFTIDYKDHVWYKEGKELGLEQGLEQGLERGLEQGLKQGEVLGIEKSKKEVALKMLKDERFSLEDICLITGLSIDAVQELKRKA